jgi:hypothetical protein
MVQMDLQPDGMLKTLGAALGSDSRWVNKDFERFKQMIESRGVETGAWRGQVDQHEATQ